MFSRGTKVNLRNIERKLLACPDIQVLYYNAYDILIFGYTPIQALYYKACSNTFYI